MAGTGSGTARDLTWERDLSLPLPITVEEAVLATAQSGLANGRGTSRNWFEVDGTYYTFVSAGGAAGGALDWEAAERYCRLHASDHLGAGGSG